jgi:hypothetical protein
MQSKAVQCKFCGLSFPKLVKSHIIPRSFYKELRDEENPYSIFLEAGQNENREKYYQAGIYDSEIACETCEKRFNPFDTHGYQVLTKALKTQKACYDQSGHEYAYIIEDGDYKNLKLFVLSMLWRAHASSHKLFGHVNLGPHADTLKTYITDSVAPEVDNYGVVFLRYAEQDYSGIVIPPWRHKFQGINIYRFYLPDLVIIIKVDKRPMPQPFRRLLLQKQPPHCIGLLPGSSGSERRYIEDMKRQFRRNHEASVS